MTTATDIAIAIKDDPLPSRSGEALSAFVSNFSGTASANPPTAAQVVAALRTDPDRQRAGDMLADFIAANGSTNGVSAMIAAEVVRAIRDDPEPARSGALLLSYVQTFGPAGEDPGEGGVEDGPEELAFADFANGVYRVAGASTTPALMFDEDPDAWNTFDPETDITDDGLTGWPVLAAGLRDSLLATGFTAVVTWFPSNLSANASVILDAFDSPSNNFDWAAKQAYDGGGVPSSAVFAGDAAPVGVTAETGSGPFKFAVTILPGAVSCSFNGETVVPSTTGQSFAVVNRIGFGLRFGAVVTEAVFYPPQDDADLPALSAL